MSLSCPCGSSIDIRGAVAGAVVHCPACRRAFRLRGAASGRTVAATAPRPAREDRSQNPPLLAHASQDPDVYRVPSLETERAPAPATDTISSNDVELRACPFCGESIKAAAIRCKHCKSDLVVAPSRVSSRSTSRILSLQLAHSEFALSYAGFWKRLAAALIDGIVLWIGGWIAGTIIGFTLAVGGATADEIGGISFVLGCALSWLYSAAMESSPSQATLGKMALGIKVSNLQGERVSFGRATGRHFAKYLSALLLGVGFLMAGFTEKKQALHDGIAECLVVNKE